MESAGWRAPDGESRTKREMQSAVDAIRRRRRVEPDRSKGSPADRPASTADCDCLDPMPAREDLFLASPSAVIADAQANQSPRIDLLSRLIRSNLMPDRKDALDRAGQSPRVVHTGSG